MKTLSIFLFVLNICMISHVYGQLVGAGFNISNELQNKKKLWFSCYSGDDRIAPGTLEPGASWGRNFKTNIWENTWFMCTLKQGPNYRHHQSFTAFKQETRENDIYLKVWGGKDSRSKVNMHKKYDWIY
ncbi:hypothetical protein EUTSA_v10026776mg [Eutrema salsugineum]|uniref:S-protein homolog n=1 Tax=Eutrema salsugineum TaxID=72664 RepID=V4MK68_EUTSA|nr:hypothetical protein EUTSA_v10026776mg [Eutrema salsugineum]